MNSKKKLDDVSKYELLVELTSLAMSKTARIFSSEDGNAFGIYTEGQIVVHSNQNEIDVFSEIHEKFAEKLCLLYTLILNEPFSVNKWY
ncbi:hypothetical protein COU53_04010 [Candidatus Pacearchaeota archaeon CG10_big_fil_rev_8_21_14_0_10_30_48]|nr:MAG: hypothetical protein COU53_04010 [Candidatus Pacearchaeota archaeon CG10_big_fil_rev_8_21_14_0_10_30_48]